MNQIRVTLKVPYRDEIALTRAEAEQLLADLQAALAEDAAEVEP